MTENISSTNLPQNPDASDLAMCTRHKNRMHFQTKFIPKLVANQPLYFEAFEGP